MSQANNGVLYVDSFTATGNPGEYTFENASYNNQNDSSGIGAFIIDTTFVLFAPIVDVNTFAPIPGLLGRYKFTNLTYVDTTLISGTILYDQDEAEAGFPGNGIYCLVSKVSTNLRIAAPPIDTLYSDLQIGGTIAAVMNDLINIVDKAGSGSSSQTPLPVELIITSAGQTEFTLPFTPVSAERTLLLLNGIVYHHGVINDYTIAGNVLTWINDIELEIADKMVIR